MLALKVRSPNATSIAVSARKIVLIWITINPTPAVALLPYGLIFEIDLFFFLTTNRAMFKNTYGYVLSCDESINIFSLWTINRIRTTYVYMYPLPIYCWYIERYVGVWCITLENFSAQCETTMRRLFLT